MRLPEQVSRPSTTLRAVFRPAVHGDGKVVDGAWWPRSRDLVAELPSLLAALSEQDVVVARVAYHRDSWDDGVGRKRAIGGTVIRFGWFRSIDPHSVSLTGSGGRPRLDLVVVPPASKPQLAEQIFVWIRDGSRRDRASDILAAARTHGDIRSHAASVGAHAYRVAITAWESEGGSTLSASGASGRPT